MYTPDRSFMKDLKSLDKRLGCHFNENLGNFVVTYDRPYGEPAAILRVKREDDGFRQPDQRDIKFIKSGDMENQTVSERLQKSAKYFEDSRAKARKDAKDNIRNMTKDDKIQWTETLSKAHGSGKGKTAFRKIKPKARGYTVTDNRTVQ